MKERMISGWRRRRWMARRMQVFREGKSGGHSARRACCFSPAHSHSSALSSGALAGKRYARRRGRGSAKAARVRHERWGLRPSQSRNRGQGICRNRCRTKRTTSQLAIVPAPKCRYTRGWGVTAEMADSLGQLKQWRRMGV